MHVGLDVLDPAEFGAAGVRLWFLPAALRRAPAFLSGAGVLPQAFLAAGPGVKTVIDALQQRRAGPERIVLGKAVSVPRGGLYVGRQRRLIDLGMVPAGPADDLATAKRLIKLADTFLQQRPPS